MKNGLDVTLQRTVDTDKKLRAHTRHENGGKAGIVTLSQSWQIERVERPA